MDGQKLANLLQESQIPDTTRIKAITAELQKNYYAHAESLLLLIEIVCTHSDVNVRQQAAVQAARLVPKHWKSPTQEQKTAVRQHLLEATMKEQNARCRHSDARLVAAIATYDFDDGEWPELLPALFTLSTSDDVHQREIGSYIIYSTLEANPVIYKDHVPKLLELFSQLMKDSGSADVQINAVMSIGALLVLIEAEEEENEESIGAVRNLVPQMGLVLKNSVDANDDDKIQQVFEVLQQFLIFSPAFIGGHLKSLVQFMIELAANKEADDGVRVQAISFLTQTVHYRRLKIQAMRDMAAHLVIKGMEILTELGDDETIDEETPGHLALSLLDALASELPPRQVLVPLLDEFPKYASSPDPALRKAGILALGNCAEGAPDFVNTQLKSILPIVIRLLNDPDGTVRHASLVGLTGLAEEMPDDIAVEHEAIMDALFKNLQAAMVVTSDEEAAKKNGQVVRAVCSAFDSISNGLKSETMKPYALQMIEPIGRLFSHPDTRVKIAAASALGAIAESLEKEFAPYFEKSMQALGTYVTINGEEMELQLRSAVLDSIGRIAVAVGSQLFQPYVVDLMKASEENLLLEDDRLKESSFIFWASLAKVYGREFKPFLPGVLKALLEALEGGDDEIVLQLTDEEKAIIAAGGLSGGRKGGKIHDLNGDEEDSMDDEDEDEDEDWAGMGSEAEEKEVAIEVLGDIITNACGEEEMQQFLEKGVSIANSLMEHHYSGIRKAAMGMLWRSYARVWQLTEESTGFKWEPGFPPKQAPTPLLTKLAEMVAKPTFELWVDETERDVVTDINRNVAATLETCGPAILAQENAVQEIVTVLGQIITRAHPCQQDAGDEEDAQDVEESSEYDWLVVETALDVVTALAAAIGPAFGELWKIFEKPIFKIASSNESYERSAAVGTIASCTGNMGATVTPYTNQLLKLIVHRLGDEDLETKSNAAFAIGQLVTSSTDSKAYLAAYPTILEKLERLLAIDDTGHRIYDNACAAFCRLITAHPNRVPIGDYLPSVVERLPLKEDYDENKPIYTCIYHLYEHNEPTVQQLTPTLLSVFQQVLSPPEAQLDNETRELIQRAVQVLYKAHPELFQGHQDLLKLLGGSP
ncbi:importin beta-4 [Niveomyces insectorum RCEF 264]|uniref:Importin beta-4 n=1 Tax=Niveomyces insectorum RCEF 264 TaxID=1081102 RepID=A0A167PXR9_9HYPO|nr:importin beta-4 [Niveomyces insectorum RCEF 264]